MRLLGCFFHLLYVLRRHRFLGLRLDLWGVLLLAVAGLVAFSAGEPGWGLVLVILAAALLIGLVVAQRAGYLRFLPQPTHRPAPAYPGLEPDEKLLLRASGHFAIRDHLVYLVEHPAILSTPRSREHVLMVSLAPSRLLLLGQTRQAEWGWWYQFIKPAAIRQVLVGTLVHGWSLRLALAIRYQQLSDEGVGALGLTVLTFDDERSRALAWENLTREMREPATNP